MRPYVLLSWIVLMAIGEDGFAAPLPDVGAGRVAWFDITTTDLAKSKTFHGKLFAWQFASVQGTDQAAEIIANGAPIGTIRVEKEKPSTSSGVVYIQVADIEDSCKTAKELGGTVPEGFPLNLPDGRGAIALVIDPIGHPIGMYSRTSMEESGLDEASRKVLYKDLFSELLRATEADPNDYLGVEERVKEHQCARTKLTRKALDAIYEEGRLKAWPHQ